MRGSRPPITPLALGAAGLIPFLGSAFAYAFGDPRLAGPALLTLVTYSAAILSFLGGVRWGAEMMASPRPSALVMIGSNLPSLLAWGLLAAPFATPVMQFTGFLIAFVLHWAWDLASPGLPAWYRRLRTPLTVGAVLSVGLALWKSLQG